MGTGAGDASPSPGGAPAGLKFTPGEARALFWSLLALCVGLIALLKSCRDGRDAEPAPPAAASSEDWLKAYTQPAAAAPRAPAPATSVRTEGAPAEEYNVGLINPPKQKQTPLKRRREFTVELEEAVPAPEPDLMGSPAPAAPARPGAPAGDQHAIDLE
jgi:hypothetical protein